MKLELACHKCIYESPQSKWELYEILINEKNEYVFTCNKGHINTINFMPLKFQLLFESGLNAIKDGYFLESVLSLTASLERFYEFYIIEILRSRKFSPAQIEEIFKSIARQSERQLGAFYLVYALNNKAPADRRLSNKWSEFRNSVVHKGYIPNRNEVYKYAAEIFEIVMHYYKPLLELNPSLEYIKNYGDKDILLVRNFALSGTTIKDEVDFDLYFNRHYKIK